MMWDDPIVAETRNLRDQVALRYQYDVLALGEYFKAKRAEDAKHLILQAVQAMQKRQRPPYKRRAVAQKQRQSASV
jgi:hypothetical protein